MHDLQRAANGVLQATLLGGWALYLVGFELPRGTFVVHIGEFLNGFTAGSAYHVG
jgi:hypothetical protein